uniref:Transcription termination factor FttA n=1 Tax=Thermofilum pendens TaxID=2269 RepID=A0A7C4D3J6_THEPE
MEDIWEAVKEVREGIFSNVPPTAGIVGVDFEGAKVVIYTRNPRVFLENDGELVKKIAKAIKKRLVVRGDPELRREEKETREIIKQKIPGEVGLRDIHFNEVTGEVEIEVLAPEKLDPALVQEIFIETLWYPKVVRSLPVRCRTIQDLRDLYRANSEERKKILHRLGDKIYRKPLFEIDRVRLVALGAFQEVGRSALLVQTPESNILLDAGLKPTNERDELPLFDLPEFDVDSLDAVIITHAHLDHCGTLPLLYKYGYKGPVYMTEPTLHLIKLLYEDYIKVSSREGKRELYSMREVNSVLLNAYTLSYGEVTDIAPGVRLTLYRAGHILGSAMAHLHIGEGLVNIVYTGDMKYARTLLLDPAHSKFPRAEVLIMETTYGSKNDVLPSEEDSLLDLAKIVKDTAEKGGVVLIPVLAVGRAQEVLVGLINLMKKNLLPQLPIFIEGMVDEVSAVHMAFPEHLSAEIRKLVYSGESPFTYENVHVIRGEEREEVVSKRPSIILATSGMLTGGPVLDYLRLLASDANSSLVFVSYQAEGTLGRKILQGLRKLSFVEDTGRVATVELQMQVYRLEGFSGHSDRRQLENFLRRMEPSPRLVVLNHGESSKIAEFRSYLTSEWFRKKFDFKAEVIAPKNAESVRVV